MYIKGIVTIKLIDKKTNKIKYKTTHNNTMLKNGAYCIINGLTGKSTAIPISRVVVFDENKNYIKTLNIYYNEIYDYRTYLEYVPSAYDHSDDEYTFKYVTVDGRYSETPTLEDSYSFYILDTPLSKGKYDTLGVDWIFIIYYSAPP